jgi:hypothetical protein
VESKTVCYEVFRNGSLLCRAGVREGVFGATMMWSSRPAEASKPWSCDLRVGGLTGDTHVDWVLEPIALGDEVLIKVVESTSVDPPKDLRPQDPGAARRTNLQMSRKYYVELQDQIAKLEAEWGDQVRAITEEDA